MNKTAFPVGFYQLHHDVSMNFQMNRWFSWVGEPGMLDEMREAAPRVANYVDWKREFLALAESAVGQGHVLRAGFYFRAADFFMRTNDPERRNARDQFLRAMRSVYGLDQFGRKCLTPRTVSEVFCLLIVSCPIDPKARSSSSADSTATSKN